MLFKSFYMELPDKELFEWGFHPLSVKGMVWCQWAYPIIGIILLIVIAWYWHYDFLIEKFLNMKREIETLKGRKRVILSEVEFNALINGEVVYNDSGVDIALSDIGYHKMDVLLRAAHHKYLKDNGMLQPGCNEPPKFKSNEREFGKELNKKES